LGLAEDENWTVLDRKEMVSEEAFEDWKKQRTAERSAAKQKQQSPEKVSTTPHYPFLKHFLPPATCSLSVGLSVAESFSLVRIISRHAETLR
jgi:hypothetical protein